MATTAGALLVVLALIGLGGAAQAQAASKAPRLTGLRCVPIAAKACRNGIRVTVGKQLQVRGRNLKRGMRVSFRWPKGALAAKLVRNRAGFTVRVPAGTALGKIAVTVRDGAGRRSNKRHITVVGAAPLPPLTAARPGILPAIFAGNGMWIWYVSKSEGGNLDAIALRAKAAGMSTVFVKSADRGTVWNQFTPQLVADLHARGLRVCAWQFVYGADPAAEARAAVASIAAGADCFVIDAETAYEGRYAAAQRYMAALRAAIGPNYPLGFTSFPYVDYHPRLPYSVFLGPGGAQANMPQVYWKAIGGSVDAVSAKTVANNRIYGTPMAPLGQSYNAPTAADLRRFRSVWAGYGAGGLSWWSWQASSDASWATLSEPAPAPAVLPDPGWPALNKGSSGDQVIWMQQHLVSADPAVALDGKFTAATEEALKAFQTARGLAPTGQTDAATWQALLAVALRPVDWTAAR
ncbi:MAG TPA: peptidoglycan-binding domain-containing protein [Solirubrobacteraceae bacterium]|nr:peptidoglycan-binding domain-containing protein [Solirubrobacteraceae bacterium]